MADEKHFSVDAGQTWTLSLIYTGPDNVTPINMTGGSMALTVYKPYAIEQPIGTFVGAITIGTGLVVFTVPDTTTALWKFEDAHYRVVYTSASGATTRILQGRIRPDRN